MQLRNLNKFFRKVINEGRRLQNYDINGNPLRGMWFTNTKFWTFSLSVGALFVLPTGFSDDFAGFTTGFLGIFIGLFTSIVISMYDKSKSLFSNYEEMNQLDKARAKQIKNYTIQFTGLTSYSILLAFILVVLLAIAMANESTKINVREYEFIKEVKEVNSETLLNFISVFFLVIHRFLIVYFLLNFFVITAFAISSYFSFLLSEFRRIKANNEEANVEV